MFFCLLAAGQAIIAFIVIKIFYRLIFQHDRRINQAAIESRPTRAGDRANQHIDAGDDRRTEAGGEVIARPDN